MSETIQQGLGESWENKSSVSRQRWEVAERNLGIKLSEGKESKFSQCCGISGSYC